MLGWVKVDELMVGVPDDTDIEDADRVAADIVTEILTADPRIKILTVHESRSPIFRD